MTDWTMEIIIGLIVSIILFFLGFFFDKYVRLPIQRRFNTLRSVIPFNDQPKRVDLCYGLIPPGTTGRSYIAEEGDLATIYMLHDIFAYLFNRNKIHVQSHKSAEANLDSIHNLVTISGPKWNSVTELLIGEFGSPVFFAKSSGSIVYKTSKGEIEEYGTIRTPPHLARKCYGLILSGIISRSDGTKQRVMVCAGNTTLSMFGVTTYLKKLSNTRKLTKDLKKHGVVGKKRWGLILEVINNIPPDREGLVWLPMNLTSVSTRVVKYIKEDEFLQPYIYDYEKT